MAKITGTSGNDNLNSGTAGDDQFATGAGSDFVQATAGNDSYNLGYASSTSYWRYGFNDSDTLDYGNAWSSYALPSSASLRIVADLQLGTIQKLNTAGSLLGTDTVSGLDNLYGTAGNDSLKGRDAWFAENFRGQAGNDTIDGRGNEDTAEYYNAGAAITVNMAAGTVTSADPGVGSDTLREIEDVGGTNFADTYTATGFSGSSTNRNSFGQDWNVFIPQGGNDLITGNGQTILAYGGAGGPMTVALAGQTAVGTKSNLITSYVDANPADSAINPGNISASGVYFFISGNYDDVLTGGGRVNTIGFAAPYNVSGDTSFEQFRGQGGDDSIDGRNGYDRADYRQTGAMTEGIHVLLAAGTVTGDAVQIGTDTLRGIESIRGTYLDDLYDARGFTLKNAGAPSVNSGDSIVYVPPGETLAATAHNDFLAIAGNDTVIGNGATRVGFESMFVSNLAGTSVIATFTGAGAGSADYGLTDGGYGKVSFSGTYAVRGGNGNDAITGSSGFQNLQGWYGNDTLLGGDGSDLVFGYNGGDPAAVNKSTLYTDNDSLDGGNGNDLIRGDFGNDTLLGGAGNDSLEGGTGNDSLVGGTGNDTYTVGSTGDVISETSTVAGEIDSVLASLSWTLGANLERLTLTGSSAINATGNALANTITGNAGANLINGVAGNDTLAGGTGADTFRFSTTLNAGTNADTVNGFVVVDDAIQLENSVFAKLTATGVLSASFFRANTTGTAADSNDYIVYETDTGRLLYDADGNGLGAAVLFATLAGAPAITSADIFVT